ncbi:MAG: hypothetical protein ACE1ZA_14900 [Pseudomonadales bacterium]
MNIKVTTIVIAPTNYPKLPRSWAVSINVMILLPQWIREEGYPGVPDE